MNGELFDEILFRHFPQARRAVAKVRSDWREYLEQEGEWDLVRDDWYLPVYVTLNDAFVYKILRPMLARPVLDPAALRRVSAFLEEVAVKGDDRTRDAICTWVEPDLDAKRSLVCPFLGERTLGLLTRQ